MLMMHLRRLHGMHWHIVSLLGMRLGRCLEMERRIQLLCRSIRVKLMDAYVSLCGGDDVSSLLWVVRIGVVSAS